jgi:hypothetical protein
MENGAGTLADGARVARGVFELRRREFGQRELPWGDSGRLHRPGSLKVEQPVVDAVIGRRTPADEVAGLMLERRVEP